MSTPIGRHARSRPWWSRPYVLGGAAALVVAGGAGAVVVLASGKSGKTHLQPVAVAPTSTTMSPALIEAAKTRLLSGLTISPATGSTGVRLDAAIKVTAATGRISSVSVTGGAGATLTGAVGADGSWTSSGPLAATTTYHVEAVVTEGGVQASKTVSFTTLTPADTVTPTLFPTSGMEVGVGQPIVVQFYSDITTASARSAIESRIKLAMTTPVAGGWYWFSSRELHFRPEVYWPAHETVQISANLNGIDMGANRWGAGIFSDTFTVGDARISHADLATDRMTVTLNGQTLYTFPISGGSTVYPTMDGNHIVMDRESVVHMVSSTVGIPVNSPSGYDEYVYDDVHISDSGEYVHAAPWSVYAQGSVNVSHGCINVSPTNAMTFYNFSRVGDVVQVTGSPRPPAAGDHGVMDWDTPFSSFTRATTVVQLSSSAAAAAQAAASSSTTTSTTIVSNPPPPPTHYVSPGTTSAPTTTRPTTSTTQPATTTTRPTTSTTKPVTTTTKPVTTTTKA